MAKRLSQPPGVSDLKNFRAREAFDKSLEDLLKLVGSTTVDVGSIASAAIGTITVAVTGARADLGMTVQVGLPAALSTGLIPWGTVTADDTVSIFLYNRTGGAIAPGSQTYHARVMP